MLRAFREYRNSFCNIRVHCGRSFCRNPRCRICICPDSWLRIPGRIGNLYRQQLGLPEKSKVLQQLMMQVVG